MDFAELLRKSGIAEGDILERADGPVREQEVDAERVLRRFRGIVRLDAHRLHLGDGRTADVAHEVDEVAALADHASAADVRVLDPDVLRNRPGVHAVVHDERQRPLREVVLQQLRMRTEPPVEADHDAGEV